jgi:hypothetical protein
MYVQDHCFFPEALIGEILIVPPAYYVRDRTFFQAGKVFAVIISENAGATAFGSNSSSSEPRFANQSVHTRSRRFVVVRRKLEFCFACPIFTYSNMATLKIGVRPEEHGIAYSDGQDPKLIPGERGIKKPSIAILLTQGVSSLNIASRIHYGTHHPIQYNVKARDIGQVLPHHVPALIESWKAENVRGRWQTTEVTATAEEPELPFNPEEEHDHEGGDGIRPTRTTRNVPQCPTKPTDPHLYHRKNNVYGYDAKISPHMYHPVHNPYGYHPQDNPYGYHPESNACSYHPDKNPHGHHPGTAPFCYHPQFNPDGYHSQLNMHGYHPNVTPFNWHPRSNELGYHPDTTPFNYHPQSNQEGYHPNHNAYGYHPKHNPHGFHPQYHPYGYHPILNPDTYHPRWKPQGYYHGESESASEGEDTGANDSGEENRMRLKNTKMKMSPSYAIG